MPPYLPFTTEIDVALVGRVSSALYQATHEVRYSERLVASLVLVWAVLHGEPSTPEQAMAAMKWAESKCLQLALETADQLGSPV